MGYCMEQRDANFKIKSENVSKAFEACQEFIAKNSDENYRWIDNDVLKDAKTLPDFIAEWGWDVNFNADGDIDSIHFDSEKLGEEDKIFEILAPFVENKSYIEMGGEDGYIWRWVFKNGKFDEISPRMDWGE